MFIMRNQAGLVGFFVILLELGIFPQNSYGLTCYKCSYTLNPACAQEPGCSASCIDPVKSGAPTVECKPGETSCIKMYRQVELYGEFLLRECTPATVGIVHPQGDKKSCNAVMNTEVYPSMSDGTSDPLFSAGEYSSKISIRKSKLKIIYARHCTCDNKDMCNDDPGVPHSDDLARTSRINYLKPFPIHIGITMLVSRLL